MRATEYILCSPAMMKAIEREEKVIREGRGLTKK